MIDLEVIATNGTLQKRILGLYTNNNGIYYYYILNNGTDIHFSYHKDGSVWSSVGKDKSKQAQFQPIGSFKNKAQIAGFLFSQDITKLNAKEYQQKKLSSIIYVDTRSFSSLHIGCNITLLEIGRYDLLKGIESFAKEIHLYTETIPWIAITLY